MVLITRCPACQTLFKVVPDQLRISDGWARCGQCEEAFDASAQLVPPTSTPVMSQERDVDPVWTECLSEIMPPLAPVVAEAKEVNSDGTAPEQIAEEPVPDLQAAPEIQLQVSPSVMKDAYPGLVNELHEPPSFFTKQDGASHRKPLVQILLAVLCLVLLLGLAGQVVFHERDRIVAGAPGLKSWLTLLCRPLNCVLSPLQQKDAVVIDGASFSKVKADTYRLSFTLKNTASTALAVPAIELTLTDSFDQPVVRRVVLSSELGSQPDQLAVAAEWTTSVTMTVKTASMAERIVGYRLLAYYP
jgi:predicted Zn finger-like uncharacterized protein